MRKYEDVGKAIAYDDGVADGMLRGDEAWKVAQLAATLCTCPFSAEVASYTIDSAVDDAQKILSAARKAVRNQ